MRTAVVLASLLFVSMALTALPGAAADHVSCIPEDPNCCDAHSAKEIITCVKRIPDPCYTPQGYIC